jgi:hypothetical protein
MAQVSSFGTESIGGSECGNGSASAHGTRSCHFYETHSWGFGEAGGDETSTGAGTDGDETVFGARGLPRSGACLRRGITTPQVAYDSTFSDMVIM